MLKESLLAAPYYIFVHIDNGKDMQPFVVTAYLQLHQCC